MREQTEAIVDAIRELEEEPPGPRTDARHRPNPSSKSSNLDWPIDHLIAPLITGMSIMPFSTPQCLRWSNIHRTASHAPGLPSSAHLSAAMRPRRHIGDELSLIGGHKVSRSRNRISDPACHRRASPDGTPDRRSLPARLTLPLPRRFPRRRRIPHSPAPQLGQRRRERGRRPQLMHTLTRHAKRLDDLGRRH
jgi:hypothetical protein